MVTAHLEQGMSLQASTSKSASLMSHTNTELLQLKTRQASYPGIPDTLQFKPSQVRARQPSASQEYSPILPLLGSEN